MNKIRFSKIELKRQDLEKIKKAFSPLLKFFSINVSEDYGNVWSFEIISKDERSYQVGFSKDSVLKKPEEVAKKIFLFWLEESFPSKIRRCSDNCLSKIIRDLKKPGFSLSSVLFFLKIGLPTKCKTGRCLCRQILSLD